MQSFSSKALLIFAGPLLLLIMSLSVRSEPTDPLSAPTDPLSASFDPLAAVATNVFVIETKTDRYGSDFKAFGSQTLESCIKLCGVTYSSQCKSFTFVSGTKTCYLKNSVPWPSVLTNAISGVRIY